MSIFGSIMSKIFGAASPALTPTGETAMATGAVASAAAPAAATAPAATQPQAAAPASAAATAAAAAPVATQAAATAAPVVTPSVAVDVVAVLTEMAAAKGDGGHWQTSIVDLLKLLDLDSSLNARKELGAELDVHAGEDGSAQQNTALHKAVMQKLAANGGKVPEDLRA